MPWVALVLAVGLLAASAVPAAAQGLGGILYYAALDGSVRGVNVATGDQAPAIPPAAFLGANPGIGREFAFDPPTRLMWYASAENVIRSVNVDTSAPGPTIIGVLGASVGADRHLFIDYARRRLLAVLSDGSVQVFNLSDQQPVGVIPATAFQGGNPLAFRHLASDIRTGRLWYASTDGSLREFDPDTLMDTGRVIPPTSLVGNNEGAFRHFVIDPARDLLLYAATDSSVRSIDLTTLEAGSLTVPVTAFIGSSPLGAQRTITYDAPAAAPPPSADPLLILEVNQTSFRTGDSLILTVRLTPGTAPAPVADVYFVVRTPGGVFLSLTPGGLASGLVPLVTGFTPLAPVSAQLLVYTLTGNEPAGSYGLLAGLAQVGSLTVIGTVFEIIITFTP